MLTETNSWVMDIMLCLLLLWIAFEDFKGRMISLWSIILLGMIGVVLFITKGNSPELSDVMFNVTFILILFGAIGIMALRKGENVFEQIGEGDWLMLLVLSFFFEFEGFFSVVMLSCLASVVLLLGYRIVKRVSTTIPLAGVLGLSICVEVYFKHIHFDPLVHGSVQSYLIK